MSLPFIGEIRLMPYTFRPADWILCNGQSLAIADYQALYAVIGGTYGGDWRTYFNVPDFRVTAPMGWGSVQGQGLTSRMAGERCGAPYHTLYESEIPRHTHTLNVSYLTKPEESAPGDGHLPHMLLNTDDEPESVYKKVPEQLAAMAAETISTVGNDDFHENCQPYVGLDFYIAVEGIFPIHT